MRIRIYKYGENPYKAAPHRHVSKSTAMRWWAWGTHVFLSKRAMQERYPDPFKAMPARPRAAALDYSPHDLPPVELPHLHFEEPQSAAWREIHRKVILPRAQSS